MSHVTQKRTWTPFSIKISLNMAPSDICGSRYVTVYKWVMSYKKTLRPQFDLGIPESGISYIGVMSRTPMCHVSCSVLLSLLSRTRMNHATRKNGTSRFENDICTWDLVLSWWTSTNIIFTTRSVYHELNVSIHPIQCISLSMQWRSLFDLQRGSGFRRVKVIVL